MRLLDAAFKYVPASHTNVALTWKRFGYRPTTEAERRARQGRQDALRAGMAPMAESKVHRSVAEPGARRKPAQARGEQRVTSLKLAVGE